MSLASKRIAKPVKKDPPALRYIFYIVSILLILGFIYSFYLAANGTFSFYLANAVTSIILSMMFSVIVISYLFTKGWSLAQIVRAFGLTKDKLTTRALIAGCLLILFVLFLELCAHLITTVTGIQLPTNVEQVLGSEPLFVLLFAVFISPINEEIFFRAFLVPRVGILFSAIIFAVLHAGYLSISEFAAAFLFGIAAGYVFKRTGSLYSTMFAHFVVNLLAISAILLLGGGLG